MNAPAWLDGIAPPDKWRTLLLTQGPRIATGTLAVALAVQAGIIVTNLAGAGHSPGLRAESAQASTRHPLNVAAIINGHIFDVAQVQAPPGRDGTNPPPTSIPLVLSGVIAADNPQNGLAILGQSAQAAKVYAVGDNVPGGAKLYQVFNDHVVIDRGGQLESLALPRQLGSAGMPNAPSPSTAALQTESPIVDRMRKLMTDQPGLLMDVMRPQPVFAEGRQRGFRVYPGRNRQAFVRLGLKPGDLVTAINGTPLDDPARGQEILKTLSSSSEARVTVTRNGQQQDLTLNMAQVASEAEALEQAQPPSPSANTPAQAEPPGTPESTQ